MRRALSLLPLIFIVLPLAHAEESSNLKIPSTIQGEHKTKLEEAISAYKASKEKAEKEGYKAAKSDLDQAVKRLQARCAEEPQEPLPLYYLGICYQLQTDDKRAVENLARVVKLAPKFHEAWSELGDAHSHLGEYEKAETAYAHALELKPDHLDALKGRAWERMDAGRFKDAREDCKRGLEIDPSDILLVALDMKCKLAIDGPKWSVSFKKETEHYLVETDVDQPFADWIASQLELIHKVYVKVFEKTKIEPTKRKSVAIVFANAKEYHDSGGPPQAGGHYDPQTRQLFLFKYDKKEDGQMVLFHEGFHQFLHPYLARAPQWFNEGLGDYFGGAKPVRQPEEGVKIVTNWWRLPKAKEIAKDGSARSMKELMLMSRAEMYDPASVLANYAQAWSIIYFLCEYENRKYFPLLGKYFNALRAGKDQDDAYKAAFGDQDMKKIDEEWRQFMNGL